MYIKRLFNSYEICAVDGSDSIHPCEFIKEGFSANKNGNTANALNIGFYNVSRNYPVEISMVEHQNERKAFLDLVKEKSIAPCMLRK